MDISYTCTGMFVCALMPGIPPVVIMLSIKKIPLRFGYCIFDNDFDRWQSDMFLQRVKNQTKSIKKESNYQKEGARAYLKRRQLL